MHATFNTLLYQKIKPLGFVTICITLASTPGQCKLFSGSLLSALQKLKTICTRKNKYLVFHKCRLKSLMVML